MSDLYESCCWISLFMRIIPYPPNFCKMAASTIDPATGASTWVFCSHIWRENCGSFTMNAIIKKLLISIGLWVMITHLRD